MGSCGLRIRKSTVGEVVIGKVTEAQLHVNQFCGISRMVLGREP